MDNLGNNRSTFHLGVAGICSVFLQQVFGTTGLGVMDWVLLLGLALVVIFAEEARKFVVRHFFTKSTEDLSLHDHTEL